MTTKVDLKIVLLGKEGGGKTSLVERYLHGRFSEGKTQATVGAAFGAKKVTAEGKPLTLGIWDTAGSERYEAMSRIYYRGARAAIVCYDITDASSFDRVKFWVSELKDNEENCAIYVCGTKADMVDEDRSKRKVDVDVANDYAGEIKARLFETSSKTGANIEELFQAVAEDFVKKSGGDKGQSSVERGRSNVNLKSDTQEGATKSGCC